MTMALHTMFLRTMALHTTMVLAAMHLNTGTVPVDSRVETIAQKYIGFASKMSIFC